MRILLNMNLPSLEEQRLLEAMGFDVSRIENQYSGRHYYVEVKDDAAFKRRDEEIGLGRVLTTISYNGEDVIRIKKFTLLTKNTHQFELDEDAVWRALSAPAWLSPGDERSLVMAM